MSDDRDTQVTSDGTGQETMWEPALTHVRGWLGAILLLYLLITVGYGVVNPLFEAPDEQLHYFTTQTVAETWRLPVVGEVPDGWMGQEAAQPPLYYVTGALLIAPIDTSTAKKEIWLNPFVRLGDAGSPTNRNAFVHAPREDWPWDGYALAAHLLRLFSTLIGAGTLLCIFGAGRGAWPTRPERALAATALVAFAPQFNFLHASISNDPLVILFSAAALWQLLRLWYRGIKRRRLLLLGITLGLAILSKTAGLLLLPFSLLWLCLLILREGGELEDGKLSVGVVGRTALVVLGWTLLPALAIGGWLLWRNWTLYGDMTAASQFVRLAGGDRQFTLWQVIGESGGLWRSLFAVFGWMNVTPPAWVHMIWNGLILAALAGALLAFGRRLLTRREETTTPSEQAEGSRLNRILHAPWLPALLLTLWTLLIYAGLLQFMLRTPAAQGRLLFPALLPLALGLAYGLSMYRRRIILLVASLLALLTTCYCLLVVLPEAYALPPLIAETDLPEEAVRLDADLGHGLELAAAQIDTSEAVPGQRIWLTLYWRTNNIPGEAFQDKASHDGAPQMVVELFGRDQELVGKLQTYHGGGLYPANLWPAGAIVADRVGLQMDADMDVPVAVSVQARIVDGAMPVVAGIVKVAPVAWGTLPDVPLAQLGEGIELVEASFSPQKAGAGDEVTVEITWRVTHPPGQDLTTFVHLGDAHTPPLATGDDQPLQGFYPTRLWAEGETIRDSYSLSLPADLSPGRYPLRIGMYHADGRLPLSVAGERELGDGYLVGWLTVE